MSERTPRHFHVLENPSDDFGWGGQNPSYANQVPAVYVSPVTEGKNRGWEKMLE